MPAGAPTKYTEELLDKAQAYLDGDWKAVGDKIPSIAGLACYLDITRETVHTWVKEEDKQQFSDIVNKILRVQEKTLVNHGLDGTYNASITKLILGKHGYSDKQDTNHSGNLTIKGILEEIQDNG